MTSRIAAVWDRPLARIAAIAIVAVAAVAGFVTAFLLATPRPAPALQQTPITVKRALSTTAALFGDRIEAEIDVYSDGRHVDPASVRVRTDFRPYRTVSTRVDRTSRGDISLARSRIVLSCLGQVCVPPRAGSRTVQFRPFTVSYRVDGRATSVEVPWAALQVASRIPLDATRIGVVDAAPALDPRFDRSPTLLRVLLLVAAAMLGLAGAALVATGLWPQTFYARYRSRKVSALERSLRDVEEAAQVEDEAARRQALDRLATQLAGTPSPALEARTRALAWGAELPEPETLALLADQVRSSLNGGPRS